MTGPGYRLTVMGILFDRALTEPEHEQLGRKIFRVHFATRWQIGDWLIAGTQHYQDCGPTYERASAELRLSFDTLSSYLKVSLAYGHDERGIVPWWTYYREALRLPTLERLRTLQVAAQNRWRMADLLEFITHRDAAGVSRGDVVVTAGAVPHVRGRKPGRQVVCCPKCGEVFPVAGRGARPMPISGNEADTVGRLVG